jgi:hypothetical protein
VLEGEGELSGLGLLLRGLCNVNYFSYSIKVSTDKKYVLIIVCEWVSSNCMVEARPYSNLQKIIYHQFQVFDR